MSLIEYFRILRRWGWLMVLSVALAAGAAYIFSRAQTPIYRATSVVNIQAPVDPVNTPSVKALLRSYVKVIDSKTFAQKVINSLQLDRSAVDLLSNVTIASDDSSFVIQIDVRDPNGDTANDIAAAWANELVSWRNEQNAKTDIGHQVQAVIVDPPAYTLYRPITQINVLAGGILGLLLGGVLVFVMEYVAAGVIRSSEDVDRLHLPVLGAIPSESS
jgi:capsular polysaccharide biosynthesis protein